MNDYIKQEEIVSYTIDQLKDLKGYCTEYGSDLHNQLFNTDYYIIGTYQAKEWLGSDVFEAIETIKEYEQDNFGKVTTYLGSPEAVVNMYVYIVGEWVMSLSNHLQEECLDRHLEEADFDTIIAELEE